MLTRAPLSALVALLLGLGLAKVAVRLAALGVLLAVVVGCVGALTVGIAILRAFVLG